MPELIGPVVEQVVSDLLHPKGCHHCGHGVVWSDFHPEWTIFQPIPLVHQSDERPSVRNPR